MDRDVVKITDARLAVLADSAGGHPVGAPATREEERAMARELVELRQRVGELQERYGCNTALLRARTKAMNDAHARVAEAPPDVRPLDEWHEGHGEVLWWRFPVVESPYVGSPLDDDFPDYVTHWTRFAVPSELEGSAER